MYNFVTVLSDLSQSFVFVQEDGERSIVMATGATSLMNRETTTRYFGIVQYFDFTDTYTSVCVCSWGGEYQGKTRAIIPGGAYSYICVLPDQFHFKSTLFQWKLVGQNLNLIIYMIVFYVLNKI